MSRCKLELTRACIYFTCYVICLVMCLKSLQVAHPYKNYYGLIVWIHWSRLSGDVLSATVSSQYVPVNYVHVDVLIGFKFTFLDR